MPNKFSLPNLGLGLGLRSPHFPYITEHWPEVDWFEIISENFMDSKGRPRVILDQIAERYPVVMHGVSLSIGSSDPLNTDYLKKLKKLADEVNPVWISDHLCWTGIAGLNTHDLLPMPLTEEALDHVVGRIKQVQEVLERPLVLENPSTYLEFADSTIDDWDFMGCMAKQADCGILLDVNNIYVCARNHGWDAKLYIDSIPAEHVVQFHLAGHEDYGTHVVDTHSAPVIDEVWELYRYANQYLGEDGAATLLEWDSEIPPFPRLIEELQKANQYMTDHSLPISKINIDKKAMPTSLGRGSYPHPLHHITVE